MINPFLKYLHPLLIVITLTAVCNRLAGQDLNKEVYVVRPYEPTLSDAVKINFLPENNNTDINTPHFEYSISPKRLEGGFEPDAIKPAKTLATSLPKIYNSWLKIGLGNYTTSLAELNISNVRSKEYAYGAYLYHKSSNANIRLANNEKVPSDYAVNKINLYGRKYYPKMKLTGDMRLDHRGFNYYGYNTEIFSDSVPPITRDSIHQRTYLLGLDLGLASTYTDSIHLNYKLDARYDYFFDKDKNKVNRILVEAGLNKNFNGLTAGLDLSLDYSQTEAMDTVKNTLFRFSPWISKRNKDWKFVLGFEAVSDMADINNFYLYPHASLDIIIIEKVLIPFIGLSGKLEQNSYMQLADENQFIVPGLHLKNTSSNLIAFGGLKGSISSSVRFRADVTFTTYRNMHFFVNDTLSPLQNQFNAVYDAQVDLITYHGQIAVQPSPAIDVTLDGKYFSYNMLDQKKPWHMPDFRVDLDAVFQLGRKFSLGTGFAVIGNRWVVNNLMPEGMQKIKPVADVNLKLNYNYSKAFSLFADIYNVTDRSYLMWKQYPTQRFNFLFGLSYKL
jgi:hypothetical protein